ncbi:MAG TPA: hypothetical protein VFS01_11485 [Rhizomicrobium sp.]|nr:hypothetical protein [Rhizomicrobium sp.]
MRIFTVLVSGLILAGCTDTDWSNRMTRLGMDGESSNAAVPSWLGSRDVAAAPDPGGHAMPVALVVPAKREAKMLESGSPAGAVPAQDDLCSASAREDVNRNAFDAQTSERVYRMRLQQCRNLLTDRLPWN